jgi:hypothetical protein
VGLLWRGRDAGRAVFPGLLLGTAAYLLPLSGCAGGLCVPGPSQRLLALCFAAGVVAGLGLTLAALWRHYGREYLASAASVAGLTASLSCSIAGAGGLLGLVLGLALAAGPVLALRRV